MAERAWLAATAGYSCDSNSFLTSGKIRKERKGGNAGLYTLRPTRFSFQCPTSLVWPHFHSAPEQCYQLGTKCSIPWANEELFDTQAITGRCHENFESTNKCSADQFSILWLGCKGGKEGP